jgi:hypothetical protein
MGYSPDVGAIPPKDPTPTRLKKFSTFINENTDALSYNSRAYMNSRPIIDTTKGERAQKVLKSAAFVPAHPNLYKVGIFKVETMKYFVIHRPSDKPGASTLVALLQAFTAPKPTAAAHFLISLAGGLTQMVDLADEAPHCGTKTGKVFNYNSVGVELEGAIDTPVTDAQYQTLAKLLRTLNSISSQFLPAYTDPDFATKARAKIVGHQDIRPQDKRDPGNFNYGYLISLIPRVQVSSDYYRDAFDPRDKIREHLQAIQSESFGQEGAGAVACAVARVQQVTASYRATGLADPQRGELAVWAADVSTRVSKASSDRLGDEMRTLAQQDTPKLELDPKSFPPRLNFATGEWEYT